MNCFQPHFFSNFVSTTNTLFTTDAHAWFELLSDRDATTSLQNNQRVPWVVGAGFTGVAYARRLAEYRHFLDYLNRMEFVHTALNKDELKQHFGTEL